MLKSISIVWLAISLSSLLFARPLEVTFENRHALSLSISTSSYRLDPVFIDGTPYTRVSAPDFQADVLPGTPEILSQVFQVYIPKNTRPIFHVKKRGEQIVPLPSDLSFRNILLNHHCESERVPRDRQSYQKRYGEESIVLEDLSYAGGEKIATFRIYPFLYDPQKRKLTTYQELQIHISFIEDSPGARASNERGFAQYLVLNSKTAEFSGDSDSRRVELIIAHESYRTPLQHLINFKKQSGREVREYYVTGKTTSDIKKIIVDEYKKSTPPTSTLLIGSPSQIPSWSGGGSMTDFNYALLDAGDLADISLGRIPAQNEEELKAFIAKYISRELDPRKVEDILLTAGRDTGMGCPANADKVGESIKAQPQTVNLIKRYRTQVSTQEVYAAYNANPNIIFYDGHGNKQAMTEIPLSISNISQLSNSVFPILMDIACLNAQWSGGGRNFAESILLANGRGVAGILASGGSGYGHDFFRTIGSYMAEARKNLATDPRLNEVGKIIQLAKIKGNNQDRTYWNYYGDPSTSVWETVVR